METTRIACLGKVFQVSANPPGVNNGLAQRLELTKRVIAFF